MRNTKSIVVLASLLIATSPLALARGGSGGGSAAAGPPAHSEAAANSNGRFSSDRDTGQDRAGDRKSAKGMEHGKTQAARKGGEPSDNAAPRATPATPASPASPASK